MNEYLGTFIDESIVLPESEYRNVVYNTDNIVINGSQVVHAVGD